MSEEFTETKSLIEIETEALTMSGGLQVITITNQASYDHAVEVRSKAASWLKGAREWFKGMKDPAYVAWKKICSNENAVCDPVEAQLKHCNAALLKWDTEQENVRRAEQNRLRIEAEAHARKIAEQAAAAAKAAGADEESVAAILEEMIVAPPVAAEPTYERSSAVNYRDNWSARVTDLKALIKYVAKNPQFTGLLQVDQTALNAQARALKNNLEIPGVQVENRRVVATGRG